MTERFKFICDDENCYFKDNDKEIDCYKVVELLNELNDEKERWKSLCLNSSSENSILWNEICIMEEQGAEPSDAFKEYKHKLKKELQE